MGRVAARPIWTLDCETDPFKIGRIPAPFVWGLYDGDSFYHFATAAEWVKIVEKEKILVYAHNGGKFDYHFIREFINSDEPVTGINGRLSRFRIGEAEFRDSLNILPVSLKTFAKDDIDYALMEPEARDLPANRELILKYLYSDCKYLWEFVSEFNRKYKGRPLTQAGNAMRSWQRKSGLKAPKQSAEGYKRFKRFYFGGRVECFQRGHEKKQFRVADINSAYPHAMLRRHPLSTTFDQEEVPPDDESILTSFVHLHGVAKGSLPWRDEKGSLRFPTDTQEREYFATGHEYQAGLELGLLKVSKIECVYIPTQTVTFPHILDTYNERKTAKAEGRKADEIFAKLEMNSLYGKFGANPENYEEFVIATADSYMTWTDDGYFPLSNFGNGHVLMKRPLPEDKHRYYNCATAASITGSVRAKMLRSLHACHGVIYCDTDSIAAENIDGLDLGSELGQWKDEGAYQEYAVAGKKLYAFLASELKPGTDRANPANWKMAHKGVKLLPEEIIRVAQGEVLTYRPQAPSFSITRDAPLFINREVRVTL